MRKGEEPMTEKSIYIAEAQGHQMRISHLIRFTHSSTIAAGIMLVAAIAALVFANSSVSQQFFSVLEVPIGITIGSWGGAMTLAEIIDEVLMAIFFLLVGLEIKYEMTVGELTNIRQALLPIGAAIGGVCMPIVLYSLFNMGNGATGHGWGIPTATDIAFALGILALLGDRVPNGVRVFLSTLAVADDIIAILIIAIFYGQSPAWGWLVASLLVLVALMIMNRTHVYALTPYLLVGVVLWYCVLRSGVHSTIAGVLLALTIPSGSNVNLRRFIAWSSDRVEEARQSFNPEEHVIGQKDYLQTVETLSRISSKVIPPATRLERRLYPWVYYMILPLFALANADVSLGAVSFGALFSSPALLGVFFGLLLGKPIGIMLMSFILVKTKLCRLPENVNWMHMLGAAILGGVGFTMAIFVANLAFTDELLITTAKVGILTASALAGIIGFLFLMLQANNAKRSGIVYAVDSETPDELLQHADAEKRHRFEEGLGEGITAEDLLAVDPLAEELTSEDLIELDPLVEQPVESPFD